MKAQEKSQNSLGPKAIRLANNFMAKLPCEEEVVIDEAGPENDASSCCSGKVSEDMSVGDDDEELTVCERVCSLNYLFRTDTRDTLKPKLSMLDNLDAETLAMSSKEERINLDKFLLGGDSTLELQSPLAFDNEEEALERKHSEQGNALMKQARPLETEAEFQDCILLPPSSRTEYLSCQDFPDLEIEEAGSNDGGDIASYQKSMAHQNSMKTCKFLYLIPEQSEVEDLLEYDNQYIQMLNVQEKVYVRVKQVMALAFE